MSGVERYLREFWFARRSIGRLMMDLSSAKATLEHCYEQLPGARLSETGVRTMAASSPVEHAALIIIDQHRAEVMSIEQRLAEERATMAHIEAALKNAALSERECEYVRLRYFENRSAEAVCLRMYCSPATGGRIREGVIKKLAALAG